MILHFFLSGIFHFVKDNYFRTSTSSSDEEYDSDDSGRKDDNATTNPTASNIQNKPQPLVGTIINTAVVATAVASANSTTIHPSANDGKK